jgi:hypothetical protein
MGRLDSGGTDKMAVTNDPLASIAFGRFRALPHRREEQASLSSFFVVKPIHHMLGPNTSHVRRFKQ